MNYSRLEWKGRSVLVTGATGMLGHSAIRLLRDANADVTAMVRDASACPGSCKAMVCDLTDLDTLIEQLQSSTFDYVLHLAAQSQVDGHEAMSTFGSNISGTFHLLEAIRVSNCRPTIIVASTEGASRSWDDFSTPSAKTTDLGLYPASKMCAEILAQCYASSFDLSVGVVRLTNLYGPHDRNLRRLVPGTINSVLSDQVPTFRSDPNTLINFIYVDDAASGILRFAEQIATGRAVVRTVSIRNKDSMTLEAMVDAILNCMDRPDLRRNSECGEKAATSNSTCTPTNIDEDWGWRPEVSLEDGLNRTIGWYRQILTD